ncbi:endonuclease/exonuclease/phosphatase family protein [Suttonella ornithocola]|uniref:Uncharacterized protein conserved in bacteria n=1 Tax=Suttonella ornithocola TaxID=279832 RepID=A0A380MTR5_9GAMM|nr:endonuclease/exonuclease/phosphatase family protein [Suttonella ornithocola]SUO95584.1 Uncharacterized protein conserved in bacteria [Suttonella ornithocola]
MLLTLNIIAVIFTFLTFWGKLPFDHWWIRAMDFPRIQMLCIGIFSWLGLWLYFSQWQTVELFIMPILTGAIIYQLSYVLPYTRIWKKQVAQAKDNGNERLSILVSNVLTPNNQTEKLVQLIEQHHPDIVLTLESDKKWEKALEVIEKNYPYNVKVPLDNLYGMHLYSKLELVNPKIHYLIIDDIPSIETQVALRNGEKIWLYCLHPMPPSPTEADKSTTRDAEILMVGRHIRKNQQNAILTGDLNDVACSKTTKMFRHISGLLDPRIGRQFTNTFHAKLPFLRWALDHLFHSPCFTLVKMQRLPSIGSDHFPVLTTLQYEPPNSQISQIQETESPDATAKQHEESKEKIAQGRIEGEKLSAESDNTTTLTQKPTHFNASVANSR